MSSGTETPAAAEAAPAASGTPKRDGPGAAGSPVQLVIKDLGEIHSRLFDHRPVIQGETRFFLREFEEKRGLRELRSLEKLRNLTQETSQDTLPMCEEALRDGLGPVLQRPTFTTSDTAKIPETGQGRGGSLAAASEVARRLQQREHKWKTGQQERLAAWEQQQAQRLDELRQEQRSREAALDEEHRGAEARLREHFSRREQELRRFAAF
ncbi:biogenesis of lysosome-related organelles complex 1 subunit 5 [Suncus etruscus]|uniref:biogenesis of lysosome-related organelles complex 1 subunit 5 n=1 Tax=Suncus etruscus TaxID=109475 RepID=UPI002110152E|nr:biogenesis of lysosome-related organelles complex 1 subunit 5 [Suncus etruscus]